MDERLRELDRAAATGDLQARVRLLRERVRTGELDERRLRVAALLGDGAARDALGLAAPPPVDDAEWLREVAELDAPVALWALAEGAASEPRPERERQVHERLLRDLRDAVLAGAEVSFALQRPDELEYVATSALGAALPVALDRLGRDPHRVEADDPDVVRALDDVRTRFGYLDPGAWTYDASVRRPWGGWAHVLRYTRRRGGVSMHDEGAAEGWEPGPGAVRVRPGVLDGLEFSFADSIRARAAIRAAVLPWLLRRS